MPNYPSWKAKNAAHWQLVAAHRQEWLMLVRENRDALARIYPELTREQVHNKASSLSRGEFHAVYREEYAELYELAKRTQKIS